MRLKKNNINLQIIIFKYIINGGSYAEHLS